MPPGHSLKMRIQKTTLKLDPAELRASRLARVFAVLPVEAERVGKLVGLPLQVARRGASPAEDFPALMPKPGPSRCCNSLTPMATKNWMKPSWQAAWTLLPKK